MSSIFEGIKQKKIFCNEKKNVKNVVTVALWLFFE